MEGHTEEAGAPWPGKINFEKIGRRRTDKRRYSKEPASQDATRPLDIEGDAEPVTGMTMRELMSSTFKPKRMIIDGLLPVGCIVFVGAPKVGKSWMVYQAGRSIDADIDFMGRKVEKGDVLYMALEDGLSRLQSRAKMQRLPGARDHSDDFRLETVVPTAKAGGLAFIEDWLKAHPKASIVIIDVLKMFRDPRKGKSNPYDDDYSDVRPLTALANKYDVCIVLVHHTNKGSANAIDPFDRVSGTGGISGAADGTILLVPDENGQLVLYGRGRDFPEFDLPVEFDSETCTWKFASESTRDNGLGELSNRILERLRYENGNAVTPKQLATSICEDATEVSKRLKTLVSSRRVSKVGRAQYVLAGKEPK